MKFKRFLIRFFEILSIFAALFLAKTFYRAKKFKTSCDINPDTMDVETILLNKYVDYGKREMTDFKLGAFLGHLTVNLQELEFPQKQYDIDVSIDQGEIVLILPKDVKCIVNSMQPEYLIKDKRVSIPEKSNTLLVINASIHTGLLVLKD